MKFYKPALYFCICCGFLPFANSQESFDPSGDSLNAHQAKTIRIYVEVFEISILENAEIMSEPRRGNDDSKLRDELLKKAKAGKATLKESLSVVSRSGERATTESITEIIYPSEYEAPHPEKAEENEDSENEPAKKTPQQTAVPTAFEIRNLGSILEVEPILGEDGKTIDLTLRTEFGYHVGHTKWGKDPNTKEDYKMPTFYTLRANTSITLHKGIFNLVSTFYPQDDKGNTDKTKVLLMFIKADILTNGL